MHFVGRMSYQKGARMHCYFSEARRLLPHQPVFFSCYSFLILSITWMEPVIKYPFLISVTLLCNAK